MHGQNHIKFFFNVCNVQFALQNVNQTSTIRFGIAICGRTNGLRELCSLFHETRNTI